MQQGLCPFSCQGCSWYPRLPAHHAILELTKNTAEFRILWVVEEEAGNGGTWCLLSVVNSVETGFEMLAGTVIKVS